MPQTTTPTNAQLLASVADPTRRTDPPKPKPKRKRAQDRRVPPDLLDDSIVSMTAAATFCGYGPEWWRKMVRRGAAPPPIRFSARRYGWRVRELKAWIAAKEAASRTAA